MSLTAKVTAALILTQAKLKKDAPAIKAVALKKGYEKDAFTNKIMAMMISSFVQKADEGSINAIINSIQLGYINKTFEDYVSISYESVGPNMKLSADEVSAMVKVNNLVKEANKHVDYEDLEAQRKLNEPSWTEELMDYSVEHWRILALMGITLAASLFYIGRYVSEKLKEFKKKSEETKPVTKKEPAEADKKGKKQKKK